MAKNTFPITSFKEARRPKYRPYLLHASVATMITCGLLGALHLWYGDYPHTKFYWAFVLLLGILTWFSRFMTRAQIHLAVLIGGVPFAIGLILLFPMGVHLIGSFLPIAICFAALSVPIFRTFLTTVGLGVLCFAYYALGYHPIVLPQLPQVVSLGIDILLSISLAWDIIDTNKTILQEQLDLIGEAEKKATEEDKKIDEQRQYLTALNEDLIRMNRRLETYAIAQEKAAVDLQEKIADQENLVDAIHHDLREPLRSIVSFTQLIERLISNHPEAKSVEDYLAFVKDGGQRLATMLDDLILYTKQSNEAREPVDLQKLIEELNIDLADSINRNGGEIISKNLPVVYGFKTQLRQLFQNLIANALKFNQPETAPIVTIHGKRLSQDTCAIEVSDNGIGIPSGRIKTVFGLFNRAHADKNYEGSGVGLALCKRIAIAHGADITATSVVGQGTTFLISPLLCEAQLVVNDKVTTPPSQVHAA